MTIEAFGLSDAGEDEGPSSDQVLRRAEAYMHAHLADPISIPDVARAAGLSVRGLQLAFQRAGRGTPLLHLRQLFLHLERCHSHVLFYPSAHRGQAEEQSVESPTDNEESIVGSAQGPATFELIERLACPAENKEHEHKSAQSERALVSIL